MDRLRASFVLERDGRPLLDEPTAGLLQAVREAGGVSEAAARVGLDPEAARRALADLAGRLGAEVLVPGPGGSVRLAGEAEALLGEFQRRVGRAHMLLATGEARPVLTVDGVVLYGGKLVAVRRRHPPFQDRPCLPGGVVAYGERTEEAVVREVAEETGLTTAVEGLVGVYSSPDRDPRGHAVSIAYALRVTGGELRAGDDALEVALLALDALPPLGFDHGQIVADFLAQRAARPGGRPAPQAPGPRRSAHRSFSRPGR